MAQFTNFNATTPIQGPSNTYTEAPTKQRRSRWGPETIATGITCRNTSITAAMTSEQIDAYVLHLRIEEITHKLRINDIVSANQYRRSPSPEPQYDASGRRTNTHYRRHRERLEKERHSLIQTAMHTFPNYSPPQDYVQSSVRQRQLKEKVYIPVKDFPEVNFIGQLLGPRGRSLAEMSTNSRASIVIRGRGSVKEGRGRDRIHGPRRADTDDHQEPLHCLITADTQEGVEKAKELVHAVIENAITTPEYDNNRKRQQLRDLAVANGTLRDDEGVGRGTNTSHGMPAASAIGCQSCGGVGHIARDCLDRNMRAPQRTPPWRKANTTLKEEDTIDLTGAEFLAKIKSD
ncbi:eukaryotic type KH-domain (KH-domain type I) [Hypoxylon rubiginosum]|uniref:Eukaryotic type KH-domain (KH-domain type I) n=1 Tax=Hypoxylon rubiginosum TaxID=110542 RepID=A0ACC0D6M7_9PEZI|nr:eukaryotic type KH-domain (KH-domain type I) [Hypoxylon rubiginosum]